MSVSSFFCHNMLSELSLSHLLHTVEIAHKSRAERYENIRRCKSSWKSKMEHLIYWKLEGFGIKLIQYLRFIYIARTRKRIFFFDLCRCSMWILNRTNINESLPNILVFWEIVLRHFCMFLFFSLPNWLSTRKNFLKYTCPRFFLLAVCIQINCWWYCHR